MWKNKLQKKWDAAINGFTGIKRFERYLIGYHLIWSDSFEAYVRNSPVSRSKKSQWYTMAAFMAINTFKYGLLFVYHEPWLLAWLGEFTYIHYKMKMMACLVFLTGLLELGRLSIYHHLETSRKFKMFEILHDILTKRKVEGMSIHFARKYSRNFFLFSKFANDQVHFFTLLMIIWCGTLIQHAYQDERIHHSLFLLILNGVNFTLFVRQMVILANMSAVMFAMTTMYLKYRFIGVLDYIRLCMSTRIDLRLSITKHKEFSDLLRATSSFVNATIGLVYYISPVIIVVPMQIAVDHNIELWKRAVMANFFILISMVAYLTSQLSTWIPKQNSKIPALLYKIACSQSKRPLRQQLRLDEFISSLNNGFLGFYAFSFFRFTKLTFYHFLFGISVTYLMVKKRLNE